MENARLADARDPLTEALPYLDAAIGDLSDSDRELVHLRFSEGLSFAEVSQRTGRSEAALRQQAGRAVGRLAGLLRRRGVAIPATTLTAGLGTILGGNFSTASAAGAVATAALSSSPALSASWLAYITLFTMSTNQCILAGAVLATFLVTGPIVWRGREIHRANIALASLTSGKDSISPSGSNTPPSLTAAAPVKTKAARSRSRAPLSAADEAKREKVIEGIVQGEIAAGFRDWFEQTARVESRRTALALKLPPELEEALYQFLFAQAERTLTGMMSDGPEPDRVKKRHEDKANLDAWFAEHLTPDQMLALRRLEEERRAASVGKLAEDSLHAISSKVLLTEDQKTLLFNAAAAKATESLAKDDHSRRIEMGLNFLSPPPPVEETSDDLIASVLDPDQREIWQQTLVRDGVFRDAFPNRILNRTLTVLKPAETREILNDLPNPFPGN